MTTVVLQPGTGVGLDTWLQANNPTFTRGAATTMLVGMSAGGLERTSLIAFTELLTQVPAGATVSSALLGIFCTTEATATNHSVLAHRSLVEFYAGNQDGAPPGPGTDASSWSNRNQNPSNVVAWNGGAGGGSGSDYVAVATGSVVITTTGVFFEIDVTDDVQAFVNGTHSNYGWWLFNSAPVTAGSVKTFATCENLTSGNRPKLTVTYTAPGLLPKIMQYGQYSGGTL